MANFTFDARFNVLRRRCKRCARRLVACHDNGCIHDSRWGCLRKYAAEHGSRWRDSLRKAWASKHGSDVLPWLREIVGAKNLHFIRLEARSNGRPPMGFATWQAYDRSRSTGKEKI
jgi:hypothetical protein